MVDFAIDEREFKRTYFALRAWLVLCCLLVLAAPVSILLLDGRLPTSISDSWHEGARMPFVFGLVMASVLLLVVTGDTLFEHVMLKAAGMFGLVVASVPCWPKLANGDRVDRYPPDVAHEAVVSVGVLLVLALLAFGATLWLSERLDIANPDEDWTVPDGSRTRLVLMAVCPALWAFYSAWFLISRYGLVHSVHFGSAVMMFVCLALVAVARTTWGLEQLGKLGDRPVDRGSSTVAPAERSSVYDGIYAGIAIAIPLFFTIAFGLSFVWSYWVLAIEFTMLTVFGCFWVTQTLEALGGLERKRQAEVV